MKKVIILILIGLTLSGCSFFRLHKMDIQQGNIFTEEDVRRLHPGMSEGQVRSIMGTPVLIHVFTTNEIAYVYTNKPGHGKFEEKKVVCIFDYGTLREIRRG
jgi:outer membrane protein assembly factor BamE